MRRGSQTVRQRSAKSRKSVRLRSTPPFFCPNPGKKHEYRQGFASYRVSGASYFAVSRKMLHTPSGVLHKKQIAFSFAYPAFIPRNFSARGHQPFCGFCAITVLPRKVFSKMSNCLSFPFFHSIQYYRASLLLHSLPQAY